MELSGNVLIEPIVAVKPKRGRRSKNSKDKNMEANSTSPIVLDVASNHIMNKYEKENDNSEKTKETQEIKDQIMLESNITFTMNDVEKATSSLFFSEENSGSISTQQHEEESVVTEIEETKPVIRKRGRKPKGGKIVTSTNASNVLVEAKPNIILHLKCSMKDLLSTGFHNENFSTSNIESFHFADSKNELSYEFVSVVNDEFPSIQEIHEENSVQAIDSPTLINISHQNTNANANANTNSISVDRENGFAPNEWIDTKQIWKKLKSLEQNLHMNNISDKKSACFWCSYDFDNPPIYIPKYIMKDSYHVYGCFCSPECAVAYLMEENIDSSAKFERYHLLNHVYSKIYDYKKNIKPAPNPYYMLDKYYGNLTIQEYRSLLNTERLFLIVDKPLTRILPEFHEDNDDFIINNKIIPSNNYQMKKKHGLPQKKIQTKNNIMNEKFGFSASASLTE